MQLCVTAFQNEWLLLRAMHAVGIKSVATGDWAVAHV